MKTIVSKLNVFNALKKKIYRWKRTTSFKNKVMFPQVPLDKTGSPMQPRNEAHLSYRGSYDWTIWGADQLKVMERYWLDFAKLMQSLMPKKIRNDLGKTGINLGTFNGSYQKAWMRLGYKMYGIELVDVIDELHAYGCDGEKASFLDLSNTGSSFFDFAIMDRCLFNKEKQCFYYNDKLGKYMEKSSVKARSDVDVKKAYAPLYFSEASRVLKPDGVLFVILYENWSEDAMRQLYDIGEVKLILVDKPRPYLIVVVDKGNAVNDFPELPLELFAEYSEANKLLKYLNDDHKFGKSINLIEEQIKFHYLPTNHLAVYDVSAKKILSDELIINDPLAAEFFGETVEFEKIIGKDRGIRTILLLDKMIARKKKNLAGLIANKTRDLYACPDIKRGSKSLEAVIPRILIKAEEISEAKIVIAVSEYDVQIVARNNMPRVPIEKAKNVIIDLSKKIKSINAELAVLMPPKISAELTGNNDSQIDIVEKYRKMLFELSDEINISLIDWCAPIYISHSDEYKYKLRENSKSMVNSIVEYLS